MGVGWQAHDLLSGPRGQRAHRVAGVVDPAAAAVLGVATIGTALRFYRIAHQGFWFDEANTAMLVHLSPGKMLGLLPQSESTPPLYYCVAWVWARVFGFGEGGLRSLSAVAGTLTIPVAYGIGAQLLSRRAGVIAAALTACSPLLIWYSQEARSYSLLVLLAGLSLLAFAHAREAPTPRTLTLWALASALALATHYYAVLAVVPEALWLLAEHRHRPAVRAAFAFVALCGLALIPLALSQNGTGNDRWIASAPVGPRLRQILPQFLIGTNAPDRMLLKYVSFALALAALGLLALPSPPRRPFQRAEGSERNGALMAGALALAGFALSLILLAAGFDDLITRNIIVLWLPCAMLVAGGLAVARARALGPAIAAALCAVGVIATLGIATERSLQRPDWRYVARELGPPPTATPAGAAGRGPASGGGRAILIQHYAYLLPLSLYLHGLSTMRHAERVSEIDVISMVSPQQPLCWWGAACNLIPSQMQRRYPIRGFHPVWRRHVLQFTILRLVSDRPVTVSRADVSAALRTTRLRHDELIYQHG